MVSPIWFTNFVHEFFSAWVVEKEIKFHIDQKRVFFFSVCQLKKIDNKYSLNKIRRFGIWNWWNHLMNSLMNFNTSKIVFSKHFHFIKGNYWSGTFWRLLLKITNQVRIKYNSSMNPMNHLHFLKIKVRQIIWIQFNHWRPVPV